MKISKNLTKKKGNNQKPTFAYPPLLNLRLNFELKKVAISKKKLGIFIAPTHDLTATSTA